MYQVVMEIRGTFNYQLSLEDNLISTTHLQWCVVYWKAKAGNFDNTFNQYINITTYYTLYLASGDRKILS